MLNVPTEGTHPMGLKSTLTTAVLAAALGVGGTAYVLGTDTASAAPAALRAAPTATATPTALQAAPAASRAPTVLTCSATPSTAPQAAPEAPAAAPASGTGVNLNTATHAELVALPGIGDKTASRIEAARPLASVDDVAKLPGVTPANYTLFVGKVTV